MVTQRVVAKPARSSIFLVMTIREGAEAAVRDVLANVSGITRSAGFRAPDDDAITVVGIGSNAWDRLFGTPKPAHLHPFIPFAGDKHTAPSTPGDLLFHLRARQLDVCFEIARILTDELDGLVDIVDEVHGFKYFDERDLLGFVDGTENPEGKDATDAVLVDDDPEFNGGSYVIVQKYTHDLRAWGAQPVEEQERVIGRTKLDDVEFPDDVKPTNSHVALNTIEDAEGNEHDIMRFNMAFGDFKSGEKGTYFIGYAKDPAVTEQMLENMFIGKPEGNYDRILDFSTALTGCLFFVPSIDLLDGMDGFGSGIDESAASEKEQVETEIDRNDEVDDEIRISVDDDNPGDGSLGIGSLRPTANDEK